MPAYPHSTQYSNIVGRIYGIFYGIYLAQGSTFLAEFCLPPTRSGSSLTTCRDDRTDAALVASRWERNKLALRPTRSCCACMLVDPNLGQHLFTRNIHDVVDNSIHGMTYMLHSFGRAHTPETLTLDDPMPHVNAAHSLARRHCGLLLLYHSHQSSLPRVSLGLLLEVEG